MIHPLAVIGYPLIAAAAMNASFGLFLLVSGKRKDPALPYLVTMALISAVYCLVIGVAYVRASLGLHWEYYYRSAWAGWLALAPLTQAILVLRGDLRRARRWGRGLYFVWGTILVLCWTTDRVEVGAVSLIPFVDRAGQFEAPARWLGALNLGYVLYEIVRVRRASTGRRREQLGYLLLGTAIYASAGLLLAGIPQIFAPIHFDPGLVAYFSVPWVAFTFYATTRHRLFEIRFVLSRAVQAIVSTVALAAANIGLFWWLAPATGALTAVTIVSLASGVVLFMTPAGQLLHRAIERIFLRPRYDYQRAVKDSAQAFASLLSVDEVLQTLLEQLRRTLGTACGALFLEEEGHLRLKKSYGRTIPPGELPVGAGLARWIADRRQIFVRDEQEGMLAPSQMATLDAGLRQYGGEVAVPIASHEALRGILILGRKSNKDAFFQTDVDLLETIATGAAVALANARLLEELQQAVRVRDDFLSVAGHELRTPLTTLQLSVDGLMRPSLSPEQFRQRLLSTQRQVSRLTRLISELLDVSRITAGRLTLEREPVDLTALVREVTARFADELKRARSPLEMSLPEPVMGTWDRMRIEQAVGNLLSNAIKYGRGKPISIAVHRVSTMARLTVRDRGIGISHDDQARIFGRFERAVSPQQYGGLGLGLWITKQVIDAHGGTIDVTSEPGSGSTFVVDLPTGVPIDSASTTTKAS